MAEKLVEITRGSVVECEHYGDFVIVNNEGKLIYSEGNPFKEAYFLEPALKFRAEIKCPLIYVGGLVSRAKIDEVLDKGFELVQMARALVHDPEFVNKMKESDSNYRNGCKHSNYCIGRMYTLEMKCHHCVDNLPKSLVKEIEKAEAKL